MTKSLSCKLIKLLTLIMIIFGYNSNLMATDFTIDEGEIKNASKLNTTSEDRIIFRGESPNSDSQILNVDSSINIKSIETINSGVGNVNVATGQKLQVDSIGSSNAILRTLQVHDQNYFVARDVYVNFFDNGANYTIGGSNTTITGTLNAIDFYNSTVGSNAIGNIVTLNNANLTSSFDNNSYDGGGINTLILNGTLTTHNFYNGNYPNDDSEIRGGNVQFNVDYDDQGNAHSGKIIVDGGILSMKNGAKIVINPLTIPTKTQKYNIVETIHGGTIDYDENTKVASTSALVNVKVEKVQFGDSEKALKVTETLNQDTLSSLGNTDEKITEDIINITTDSISRLSFIKTKLFAISDAVTLKKAVDTLSISRNNMDIIPSIELTDKLNSSISSHLFERSFDYNGLSGFATGNNQYSESNPFGIWGQFFGGKTDQDEREGESGYKSRIAGVVIGSDTVLNYDNVNSTVGVAFSYGNSNVDSKGDEGQNTRINSYQLALYNNNIGKDNLGFYNENIINVAYNRYNSSRTLFTSDVARANYSGTQYGAKVGFGYNVMLAKNLLLSPKASIKYSRLNQDGYHETGAGNAGLVVSSDRLNTLVSEVGAKVVYKTKVSGYDLLPDLNASWLRNLRTKGQNTTTSFIAGGDEINNTSASLVKDVFDIGVGITASNIKKSGSSLSIKYDRQQGVGYSGNAGYIKYRMEF